jgi:hypothetical protein
MDPYLNIEIELAPKIKNSTDLKDNIEKTVTNYLRHNNSEYKNTYEAIGPKAIPDIELSIHGDEKFKYSIKPKWIEKVSA